MKNRINKRIEIKRDKRGGIKVPLLLFLFFFPFFMSGRYLIQKEEIKIEEAPGQVWVLQDKIWGSVEVPLEEYLIGMMACTIPVEYETQTLKAQTVILRSFCMSLIEKENGKKVIRDLKLKSYYLDEVQREKLWKEQKPEFEKKIKQVIEETKGEFMVCDGTIINPPFFRLSNGYTRDVIEYKPNSQQRMYIKSVECTDDKKSEDYIQYIEMTQKEFEKKIKELVHNPNLKLKKLVLCKDKNNYVKEVEINGKKIDGETFRKKFCLVSSYLE